MPAGTDATETNHFGTHEFLRLCQLLGAEPYLAGNVTSSSPRELHDWASYCNAPPGTLSLAAERKANGHPEPFGVRYWGIGNESWGCGGNFKPEEYATVYRRFATQFPKYTQPFLIAAGPNRDDFEWTRGFFGNIPKDRLHLVDGWALHYYTHHVRTQSPAVNFTRAQWYRILHAGVIEDQWNVLGEFDKEHRIKFVIDEWGTWHLPGDEIDPSYLFGQVKTLRDALHAAITLDIFHRHTEKIAMANISEAINSIDPLFLAKGDQYVRTPAYYVFDMYRPHQGGRLVPMEIQAHQLEYSGPEGPTQMFGLAGSASLQKERLTITLVNPSLDAPVRTDVRTAGVLIKEARATVLTHEDMQAANTFSSPEVVVTRPLPVSAGKNTLTIPIPKQSVVALQLLIG